MQKSYFLVTTAIEETWSDESQVLFLGEWCRLYARKDRWSKMNATILPYHWNDRGRFYSDYLYINELYEKTLCKLAAYLNLTHGVDHSIRYWRILIGPWLAYFIQMLMDRWLSIQCAVDSYDISKTIILTGFEADLVPNDMNQFNAFFWNDAWNHLIYSEIIKHKKIPFVNKESINEYSSSKFEKHSLKNRLFAYYSKVAGHFTRKKDVFIRNTYLSNFNHALLHLKFRQFPQFWDDVQPVQSRLDMQHRDWRLELEPKTEFEDFLNAMIPKQIPKVFLEGYYQLGKQIEDLPWPKNPSVIYSSNILWHDTVSMAYTATKVDDGSKLVYGQHGGVYGTAKFSFAEEHEIKISDRYLTWGWGCESKESVIPVGINKAVDSPKINWNRNECLLLVTLTMPRYSYRLSSESAISFVDFLDKSFVFVERLTETLKKKLLVRLLPSDMGWSAGARWKDRFPLISIDIGARNIYKLMKKSRVVVSNYNQTSFLETLSMRIPSILFCSLETTPLRESAIPFYAELKRVGIFHDTPESAADHLNKVWDDVNAWWMSNEVQSVIIDVTNHYCHQTRNIVGCIGKILKSQCGN